MAFGRKKHQYEEISTDKIVQIAMIKVSKRGMPDRRFHYPWKKPFNLLIK